MRHSYGPKALVTRIRCWLVFLGVWLLNLCFGSAVAPECCPLFNLTTSLGDSSLTSHSYQFAQLCSIDSHICALPSSTSQLISVEFLVHRPDPSTHPCCRVNPLHCNAKFVSFSFYSTCEVYMDTFATATTVARCRSEKWNRLHLELKVYMKRPLWAEKANLGMNMKIGVYRHHKNTIRAFLNP